MNLPRIIIDAALFCPHCGARHVDESRNGEKWHRRAHTTHRCQSCGGDFDVYVSGQSPAEQEIIPASKVDLAEWFEEPLHALHGAAVKNTGINDPRLTVKCSAEFGLRIGMPVGSWARFRSPHGLITIETEKEVK